MHLSANLAHIVYIYLPIIIGVWLLALCKDIYVRKKNSEAGPSARVRNIFMLNKHEPWMHNFFNRFIYETFFEVLFCSLISIANIEDLEGGSRSEIFLAGFFLILLVSFTIYLLWLFCNPTAFKKTCIEMWISFKKKFIETGSQIKTWLHEWWIELRSRKEVYEHESSQKSEFSNLESYEVS